METEGTGSVVLLVGADRVRLGGSEVGTVEVEDDDEFGSAG